MSNSIIDTFSKVLTNDSYGKYSDVVSIPTFESLRTITINRLDREPKYKLCILNSNYKDLDGNLYVRHLNNKYNDYYFKHRDTKLNSKDSLHILYFDTINYFKRLLNKVLSLYKTDYIDIYYNVEGIGTLYIYVPITKIKDILIKDDLMYRKLYEEEFLPKYTKTKRLQRTIEKQYESRHNSTTIE